SPRDPDRAGVVLPPLCKFRDTALHPAQDGGMRYVGCRKVYKPPIYGNMRALKIPLSVDNRVLLSTLRQRLPEHHPILLAKEIATWDSYSGGRVIVDAGAGWLRQEAEILKTNYATR